eukprot:1614643-Alexandrium_andersonii.AAC.1
MYRRAAVAEERDPREGPCDRDQQPATRQWLQGRAIVSAPRQVKRATARAPSATQQPESQEPSPT